MSKLGFLIAIAVIAAGLDGARADTYPSHVVKIIVPIAAGGPIDTVARTIAQTLSERLKQPFIVENRPGAGGNVGIQAAIHAEPDGYTLLLAAGSMLTISPLLYKVQPFDPEVDMQPLSILTVSSQTLVVHPSLPVNSLRDLVAYAKKKPLAYATSGYGSPSHLAMEYLRLLADFPAAPVSYRGLSPLMVDLISGQVKVGFVATSGIIGYVRDGKLRGIAISSARRSQLLKDVPTIAESGYPDYEFDSYVLMLDSFWYSRTGCRSARTGTSPGSWVAGLREQISRPGRTRDRQYRRRSQNLDFAGNQTMGKSGQSGEHACGLALFARRMAV